MVIKSVLGLDKVAQGGSNIYMEVGDKKNLKRELKFKFLSPAEIGYEWWEQNTDPLINKKVIVHRNIDPKLLPPVQNPFVGPFGPSKVKEMLAAVVWDYESESIKILSINQQTVIKALIAIDKDEDFGDIQEYDWKIKWNDATGTDREYSTLKMDKSEITDKMAAANSEANFSIDLYMAAKNQEEKTSTPVVKEGEGTLDDGQAV